MSQFTSISRPKKGADTRNASRTATTSSGTRPGPQLFRRWPAAKKPDGTQRVPAQKSQASALDVDSPEWQAAVVQRESELAASLLQRHADMTAPGVLWMQAGPEEEKDVSTKPLQRESAPEKEEEIGRKCEQESAQRAAPEEEKLETKSLQREAAPDEELDKKPLQREAGPDEELEAKRLQRVAGPEEEVKKKALQREPEKEEEAKAKPLQREAGPEEEEKPVNRAAQEEEKLSEKPLQRADEELEKKALQREAAPDEELDKKPLQRESGPEEEEKTAATLPIQAAMKVSQPNDPFEQEADRTAERVLSMDISGPAQAQREAAPEEKEEVAATKPLAAGITPLSRKGSQDSMVVTA